jgi:pyrroline-5-carboxylate reductase
MEMENQMQVGKKKIGIIGGGNMGEAFAGAMIKTGIFQPSFITISDIMPERLNFLKKTYGINITQDNFMVFDSCDVLILAVKPQQMDHLLTGISRHPNYAVRKRKLIISIAAGITIGKIENLLYKSLDDYSRKMLPVIRVMPNTPALVLQGMSGMSSNQHAQKEEIDMTRKILKAMGHVIEFDEQHIDAVTALSGSGPAYVFYIIESMIAAGMEMNFNYEDAKMLTLNTIKGSVALMEARSDTAEELRKKVTSPGGTTEAAFKILEKNQVKQTFIQAIIAAANRASELSK